MENKNIQKQQHVLFLSLERFPLDCTAASTQHRLTAVSLLLNTILLFGIILYVCVCIYS